MSLNTRPSLSKLKQDIQAALKLWQSRSVDISSLDYLLLVQKARQGGANSLSQATRQVILHTLQVLENDYEIEAELLRRRFLKDEKMQVVANQLGLAEPTAYKVQREAIQHLATTLYDLEAQAIQTHQAKLEKRLKLPPKTRLFGVEAHLKHLLSVLSKPDAPWILSIEGLGGIGKTALANLLVRQPGLIYHYDDIAWVSAKQQEFLPGLGIEQTDQATISADSLVNALLEQLEVTIAPTWSHLEKIAALTDRLKNKPHLIVIDNLETVADYMTLLPSLRKLINPSKFLLTSRHSLRTHSDVFSFGLQELSDDDTINFIKYEAQIRSLPMLAGASENQLNTIYEVVGGNPLALKLVIGQISFLPLSEVIENLTKARGKTIDDLYTYIYWQAWHTLDANSQQVLLIMPVAHQSTLDQLLRLSNLDKETLNQALKQLISLSLVQTAGDLEERHYTIHRLTETFLLNEAIKWQSLH